MEWWGWVAWGSSLFVGLAGFVLGLRAELRASRYRSDWAVNDNPFEVINRTGEDAANVEVSVLDGGRLQRPAKARHLSANESLRFHPIADKPGAVMHVGVTWHRARTGKRYEFPRAKGLRGNAARPPK